MSNKNLEKLAIKFSMFCASIIIAIKLFGWVATHSNAMLASLFDSSLDLVSSLINMLALIFSSKSADEKYRFGHEKVEDLAVFIQSTFIGIAGFFVLIHGIIGFFNPKTITHSMMGINIIVVTIIITTLLICVQYYIYKKTNSMLVYADRLHYFTDLLTNIGVVLSLYLSTYYKLPLIDTIFSILLAFIMIKSAFSLISNAFSNLVDREFDENKKKDIIDIVKSYPEILGMHDIKTRQASSKLFIQFHIEFDGEIRLKHSHEITENLMHKLKLKFPNAEIIIHQDPFGIEEHIEYPFEYN